MNFAQGMMARIADQDERIAADETASLGERSIAVGRIAARNALPLYAEDPENKRGAAQRAAQLAFEETHPGSLAAAREIEIASGRTGATIQTPEPPVGSRSAWLTRQTS
jgi:hypothetical protein